MTDIWLKQELKTSGGEVSTIMWDHASIGTMTLVYREADRIAGTVQLEPSSFPHHAQQRVSSFVHRYIESMIAALGVDTSCIQIAYSDYGELITLDPDLINPANVEEDYDYEYDWMETERFEDEALDEQNEYIMQMQKRTGTMVSKQLGRQKNSGLSEAESLIVGGGLITHNQPLAGESIQSAEEDYTVVLTREDGDTLIYEVYQQSHGGLPIGKATVDISNDQLEGFIDFREPGQLADRECIALLMMQELDKETAFESFNLTMLFQNQPFEEFVYEADQVH
ncbi:hypothetical protein [Paenibacillus agricola]|uniref:Uncharacterized protein n=1 Tax=Paenibacillus agricola TaxID=2716264 RepID=A0ABX0JBA2_9BACL|nr:hypothetical protein [Paenibacillus agricola]NHN31226.1 hypothetical protein [Paenibacillus agricola]